MKGLRPFNLPSINDEERDEQRRSVNEPRER